MYGYKQPKFIFTFIVIAGLLTITVLAIAQLKQSNDELNAVKACQQAALSNSYNQRKDCSNKLGSNFDYVCTSDNKCEIEEL